MLEMAEQVASWSKDPSTQTGAVITDPNSHIISVGYNGFAKGVKDTPNRYRQREKVKYPMVAHCETNAIIFAKRDLEGCTLYTVPFMSCATCAALVINAGIKRCVAPVLPKELKSRWGKQCALARMQFREAGVKLVLY
jgi:dCMP deaminase